MAGEIPNVNMGAYNNPYAVPYLNSNNSYNDDFMASQLFNQAQLQSAQTGAVPNFQGQPTVDTFQRQSSGGIGAVPLAIMAGGAGAAGGYYFANPFKEEGVFNEKMLNSLDKEALQTAEKTHYDKLLAKAKTDLLKYDEKTLNAIKSYAEKGNLKALTETERNLIKASGIKSPMKAKNILAKADNIDTKQLVDEAKRFANANSYSHNSNLLNKLKDIKPSLESVKDADLTTFIKNNHQAFGIKGTEDEIAKAAEQLAKGGKKSVLNHVASDIKSKENLVNKLAKDLNKNSSYFEKGGKKLIKDAPEAISKAFKNFKWKNAGKIGLIAAGIGLLIGLFTSSSKKA